MRGDALAALLLAVGVAAARGSGSCAPGPAEIFDFQVGDVFEYRIHQTNQMAKTLVRETVRKSRVVSRRDSGSVRIYGFAGREERTDSSDGVFLVRTFEDHALTEAYAMGAGGPLNGCHGDTVTLLPDTTAVTVVEARQGDTSWFPLARPGLRMKRLGGKLWVRIGSGLIPAEVLDQEIFAEGLGLVDRFFATQSSTRVRETLIGFVRSGDTVGTVSPDSRFEEVSALAGPPRRSRGISKPGILSGKGGHPIDLRGRRLPIVRLR